MENIKIKTEPSKILDGLGVSPDAWTHAGMEFETIKWVDEPKTTKEDFNSKRQELETKFDEIQYQRERLTEYPSIQECVHAILDNDLEALQVKRSAVKAKYPKPE